VHRPNPQTSTRHDSEPGSRRAAAAGWALLLVVLLLLLAFGAAPERSMFLDALFDAGHTPLFGGVALAVLGLLRARAPGASDWPLRQRAFLLTVAIGAVTEVLQVFQASREPSLVDFVRDAAGAAAFLLLLRPRRPVRGTDRLPPVLRHQWMAVSAGVLLLAASAANLGLTTAAYVARNRAMPALAAFDGAWWERWFVETQDSSLTAHARPPGLDASSVGPLARLDLKPGAYPGIRIAEPHPDWSGYRVLAITIVSDLDAPLPIAIRVHDAAHDQRYEDRFNRVLTVAPGVNRFSIALDDIRQAPDRREMDMRRIRGVLLFAYRRTRPTHVYLGPIRLE
jgi:VanZ family protein